MIKQISRQEALDEIVKDSIITIIKIVVNNKEYDSVFELLKPIFMKHFNSTFDNNFKLEHFYTEVLAEKVSII